MVRKQIHFTEKEDKELRGLSKKTGLPFADIVRRILDFYIENDLIEDISTMKIVDKNR